MSIRTNANVALFLGVLALVGWVFAILALMDIGQGKEPNLALEWEVVRGAFLLLLASTVINILVAVRVRRRD